MQKCESCGNEYAKAFTVKLSSGDEHVFDSFECAFQTLAIECTHCHTKIMGHGLEDGEATYCCANCARAGGSTSLVDHAN